MPAANDTDKLLTLIQALDLHLALGKPPARALAEAVEDYAFVYHTEDGRKPNQRREERMKEHGKPPKAAK